MAKKNNTSLTSNLFALSNVLTTFSGMAAGLIGGMARDRDRRQREALQELRIQNMALKNQNLAQRTRTEAQRTAKTSNDVVKGDIQIELLQMALEKAKGKQNGPALIADRYPEPGDVRRGILPPE